MNTVLRIIAYVLGVLCITYSFIVYSVHSGSKFFVMWDLIGACFIVLGILIKFRVFEKLPAWINILLITIVLVGVVTLITLLCLIAGDYSLKGEKGSDYVIVLGAQVRDDGPSVVLTYRLEKAAEYLKNNPETICIVSGGQGSNEKVSEAAAMRDYLVTAGIDEARILLEDKSTDTRENIEFSKKLIPDGASIGIITNNFHMYRALYLTRCYGLEGVNGIAADSTLLYAPNNILREVCGMIKDMLVQAGLKI